MGNVTAITDTLNSGQVQAFTYDELNRLTAASTSGGGDGTYNRNWTYGQTGNITSADGNAYTYDTYHPHAVSGVANGASYVYDLNGNATIITPTTGAARLLDYDYENRLISTGGAVTMQLSYDGDGQRVLKQDGSTVTRYIGTWSEISVTAGTTTTTNYYWFAGRRVAMKVGGNTSYLYADLLGSTVKMSGAISATERYAPYGSLRGDGTVQTPYRYTGQREEDTLGLYDYGARWYDPSIGRFIQADTIVPQPGNPQSLNRYSYALNNPMRYTDPTGHDPLDMYWNIEFEVKNHRTPTDLDRQLRLYSLMYNGPVSGSQFWTSEDWATFSAAEPAKVLRSRVDRESLDDFASTVGRLSRYYYVGEQAEFTSALALIYAQVPYRPGNSIAVFLGGFGGATSNELLQLGHSMEGFSPLLYNKLPDGISEENTHHYSGQLLAGYNLPLSVNILGTVARELAQGYRSGTQVDMADIYMGFAGALHGWALAQGMPSTALSALIRWTLRQ